MPKVSQEHADARRAQILEGARRCFARHGYSGATVARLEQEIGLSRGAIFNYFPSKQDLFAAAAIATSTRVTDILYEQWPRGRRPDTRRGGPGLDSRPARDAGPAPPRAGVRAQARGVGGETKHRPSAWIAARQADGTIRDDLDATAVTQFVGMLLNGLALRALDEEQTDVESLLRLLHDALAPRQ